MVVVVVVVVVCLVQRCVCSTTLNHHRLPRQIEQHRIEVKDEKENKAIQNERPKMDGINRATNEDADEEGGSTEYNIINPCNSESHPAVRLGLAKIDRSKPKRSLQEAYDPLASCFVCSKSGRLRLETRRTKDAKILQSKLYGVPETYVELPGIVAPGMIASVMSCAGSWHGSIALMDKAVLARPPLMMLEKMLDFTAVDVLAPNEKCSVQSEIVSLDEPNFATVKLEMTVGHTHEQDTDTITSTNSTSTRESKQHVCARAVMRF